MLSGWALSKLEDLHDTDRVLIRDPLRLLPEPDGAIHAFARNNGFTVIVASTNLTFRQLYEMATADPETRKILVVDRAPLRRRTKASAMKAPPPLYPDLLYKVPGQARIDLDLRQFLIETTGDPLWPMEVNDPRYARLIVRNLDPALRAHKNLRTADPKRFSDHDLKTIVAFAALGIPESAFKILTSEDYWKIGLLGHAALEELESLAPEITKPIRDELRKAPAPFCWFAGHDPDKVLRAFYLSVILAQHFGEWNLLLANIDPDLKALSNIQPQIMQEAAPKLIRMDLDQAIRDIEAVEGALTKDALQLLLFDQLKLPDPPQFASVIEKEGYSTLFRSLALLLALDNALSSEPAQVEQETIERALSGDTAEAESNFIDRRSSTPWSHLKEAYVLTRSIQRLRRELTLGIKTFKVIKPEVLNFKHFWEIWNEKKVNRLEYFISALERLVHSGEFLPRDENDLPSAFTSARDRIRKHVETLAGDIGKNLDELNSCFQEFVAKRYPVWVKKDAEVVLTSQFLRRCLKPNWDPQTEKAVLFIFDGMRWDIWDELLRPMLEDRLEAVRDYMAISLLPSETHLSRKAISAGTFPDEFDSRAAENALLKNALAKEFAYQGEVVVVPPDAMGTGETIRYRADNLDVVILDLCDKELHKIEMKSLSDGRQVPGRPLAFIYQQHIKNIIDTEVMAIIRNLAPGTKIFITADHGFGYVHRERVALESSWLNQNTDCSYRNAWLKKSLGDLKAPEKVKAGTLEFPVSALRMPAEESGYDPKTKNTWLKQYATIIFPRTGYALARPGASFRPDAYTHGGLSIQELMVPMMVLRVREKDEALLRLDEISGPEEVVEGQDVECRLRLSLAAKAAPSLGEIRVDVTATCTLDPERNPLLNQTLYVSQLGVDVIYRFKLDPSDATNEERLKGVMERTLAVTASYRQGKHTIRKSRTHQFTVRLNSERVVRRVPAHLGNILGLTPKSMR